MGKSFRSGKTGVSAKERKADKEKSAKVAQDQAVEDASWADNRKVSKHEVKQKQAQQRAEEKLQKKAEVKKQMAEEEEALAAIKRKHSKGSSTPKVTQFAIRKQKEQEEKELAELAGAKRLSALNITAQAEYARIMDIVPGNRTRTDSSASATGIDAVLAAVVGKEVALVALAQRMPSTGAGVQHAAADGRMTWKLFEATRVASLKAERPGLKASQYRDILKKEWGRSPLNAKNQ